MTLLLNLSLYLAVGCGEWYLALRRTLACTRGEKSVLVTIVFFENLLGLWVLSNFVRTNDWTLALSYSAGGALGALLVTWRDEHRHPADETDAETAEGGAEASRPAAASQAVAVVTPISVPARLPEQRAAVAATRSDGATPQFGPARLAAAPPHRRGQELAAARVPIAGQRGAQAT